MSKTNPIGQTWAYKYDANGNMSELTEPNGDIKSFSYDEIDQLVQKNLPDDTYTYAYDVRGNLTRASNKNSDVNFQYDIASRVTATEVSGLGDMIGMPSMQLSYTYDTNGNRKSMTSNIGVSASYNYFTDGRLQSLTNHNGEVFNFNYDDRNRLTSLTGPVLAATFNYGTSSFLQGIDYKKSSTTKAYFNYSRNDLGYVTGMSSNIGSESYTYDSNNYLIGASHPVSTHGAATRTPASSLGDFSNESFAYDKLGNRVSDQFGSLSFDSSGYHLESDYKNNYIYDTNGNLISQENKSTGETAKFDYSSENQLTSVRFYPSLLSTTATKEIHYYFDAIGRRMAKVVVDHEAPSDPLKTFTRHYAYDGKEIIAEFDENNSVLARYTHSTLRTDDVLAIDVTSAGVTRKVASVAGSYYYLKDHLGTIKHVADALGNVIQTINYTAYGVITSIKDAANTDISSNPLVQIFHSFTGREYDRETGLYYYRARYYDSSIGRFLQTDPHPGKTAVPISIINKYIYTGNNPVNRVDPSGASWLGDVLAVAVGAIAILSGVGILAGAYATIGAAVSASAAAVGAVAAGSAVAAAGLAAFQDGNFLDNFGSNFKSFFTVSASFLVLGAIFAPGGVSSIGANTWYQGGIQSAGGSGGLTIGNAAVYSSNVAAHEAVHSLIFMGSSVVAGAAGADHPDAVWGLYGLTGIAGLPYGGPGTGDINWF